MNSIPYYEDAVCTRCFAADIELFATFLLGVDRPALPFYGVWWSSSLVVVRLDAADDVFGANLGW